MVFRSRWKSNRTLRSAHAPARGFSLIELIAVLAIVAVLAAVTVPSMNSLGDSRSAVAAHRLFNDMTYARQRAASLGVTCWVVVDVDAESWLLADDDPANPGPAQAIPVLDPGSGHPLHTTLGAGDYIGCSIISATLDGGTAVGFDWLGQSVVADGSLLVAEGDIELSGRFHVTVEVETGHVRLITP